MDIARKLALTGEPAELQALIAELRGQLDATWRRAEDHDARYTPKEGTPRVYCFRCDYPELDIQATLLLVENMADRLQVTNIIEDVPAGRPAAWGLTDEEYDTALMDFADVLRRAAARHPGIAVVLTPDTPWEDSPERHLGT